MLWQKWQEDYGTIPEVVRNSDTIKQSDQPPESAVDIPIVPNTKEETISEEIPVFKHEQGKRITVNTDVFRLEIDARGGGIYKLELLDYPISIDTPDLSFVILDDSSPSLFHIVQGGLLSNHVAPTHESNYTASQNNYELYPGQDLLEVPLMWQAEGIRVKKTYEFYRDRYLINVRYDIENQGDQVWKGWAYGQLQRNDPSRNGRRLLYTYTGAVLSSPEDRYEKIDFGDMEDQSLSIDIKDGWVAMLQHYFISAFLPASSEAQYHYYTNAFEQNDRYLIGGKTESITLEPGSMGTLRHRLYVGPKIQEQLKKIAPGLELTVDYGVLWFIAKPLFWCLNKLHQLTGNWGWAIILVTILLKIIFYQLSASVTNKTTSARVISPSARLTPSCSTSSFDSLIPAVSEI